MEKIKSLNDIEDSLIRKGTLPVDKMYVVLLTLNEHYIEYIHVTFDIILEKYLYNSKHVVWLFLKNVFYHIFSDLTSFTWLPKREIEKNLLENLNDKEVNKKILITELLLFQFFRETCI